jgi:hypothetical protein
MQKTGTPARGVSSGDDGVVELFTEDVVGHPL